jgi:hypothetical protein
MVAVELRRVPEGARDYVTVARMEIVDGGTYRLDDPDQYFPLDLPVRVRDDVTGEVRRVQLDEDPETWARNLHTVLRTGYLAPVVVEEADQLPEPGPGH